MSITALGYDFQMANINGQIKTKVSGALFHKTSIQIQGFSFQIPNHNGKREKEREGTVKSINYKSRAIATKSNKRTLF